VEPAEKREIELLQSIWGRKRELRKRELSRREMDRGRARRIVVICAWSSGKSKKELSKRRGETFVAR